MAGWTQCPVKILQAGCVDGTRRYHMKRRPSMEMMTHFMYTISSQVGNN